MARSKWEKATGRKETSRFAMIPESVLLSTNFHGIPGEAVRLLLALAGQYNGHNNGNLCAAMSVLRQYGFTSCDTVNRALRAALEADLIIRTRDGMFQGEKSQCALFALAWKPINACPNKGLMVKPTVAPPRLFIPSKEIQRPVRKPDKGRSENQSEASLQ